MKKNVLITGTSSGVGLETAVLMAQQGYKVYATMRNLDKATALQAKAAEAQVDLELLPLDVTQQATIQAAVEAIIAQDGRLDVLVNNAGAGFAKTLEHASLEEIDWVTDVNYTGVVRCIKTVLPHMREQRAGRIINVTSVGGLVGQPFNELYCAAKFAVEGLTEALATYVGHGFNIQFSLVEPGGIATEFMKSAVAKTANADGSLASGEYAPLMQRYFEKAQKNAAQADQALVYQTPLEVAQVILQVAQAVQPPLRIRTSEWAENFCHLKTSADPDGTQLVKAVTEAYL